MARKTPSTRTSALTTTSGAQTTTVSIPAGATWAVIGFVFTNVNGAPSSVTLDGQTATKIASNEFAGTDEIALYKVSGFSTGAGKTLGWTNPSGIATLAAGIEYRDGTPTWGATDADFNGSGFLASAIANTSGDELLYGYIDTSNSPTLGGSQTRLDETSTGSILYGFTTATGTGGTSPTISFDSADAKGYAGVAITVAASDVLMAQSLM